MMTGDREPFAWAALNMFFKYKDFVVDSLAIRRVHNQIVGGSLDILTKAVKAGLQAHAADTYKRFQGGEIETVLSRLNYLARHYDQFKSSIYELVELLSTQKQYLDSAKGASHEAMTAMSQAVRLLAFNLPQFHPIPENDEWWGKGFTEWTNVTKAKPLFPGHYQPHLPADLGFYDLRLPEVRKAQAELAREHGIYGFCYYHYWFNGKLLLERPLQEVLKSGEPDFPFCLCWANENWTRTWDGSENHILMEQKYCEEDDLNHIRYLCEIFRDRRYVRVEGKPLFLVYRANRFPNPMKTTRLWREEAKKLGIKELYLCRVESFPDEHTDPNTIGFDAAVEFQPDWSELGTTLSDPAYADHMVFRYEDIVRRMLRKSRPNYLRFPCVTPSWDNSPRRKSNACVIIDSKPEHYEQWLRTTTRNIDAQSPDYKIVFINAWNEWGEGNHLEPDQKYGKAYLEATKRALTSSACEKIQGEDSVLRIYEQIQSVMNAGGTEEALSLIRKLVAVVPDFALAHNDLGVLLLNKGDKEQALIHYREAVELDPTNLTFRKNLADLYYIGFGCITEALQIYLDIATQNTEDTEAFLALGHISADRSMPKDAQVFYERVLKLDPGNENARKGLALIRQESSFDSGRQSSHEQPIISPEAPDVSDLMKGDWNNPTMEGTAYSVHSNDRNQMEGDLDCSGNERVKSIEIMKVQAERDVVSIIIPVCNKLSYTKKCLKAIKKNTPHGLYEIIVVDNASTDGTHDYLTSLNGHVKVLTNTENIGFTKACNQGARISRGKYVLFLNNDTEPKREWIESLVELADADPSAGVVGSRLVYPDGNSRKRAGLSLMTAVDGITADLEIPMIPLLIMFERSITYPVHRF